METIAIHEKLKEACITGDVDSIRRVLTCDPCSLNFQDRTTGRTPLHRTVMCWHIEATQFLVESGADPNIQDIRKMSVLHQSVENSQVKFVKLLLKHKADPNLIQEGNH